MLKAEIGASTLVSVGVDALPEPKQAIVRTQALLYDEYAWPFLQIRPFNDLEAGEQYYDLPTDHLEQIANVVCYYHGLPHQVMRALRSQPYTATDSAARRPSTPTFAS